MTDRLHQQCNFLLEIDKLKTVHRQNILTDTSRQENSAEHSWHLALFAIILSEHYEKDIDLLKVIKMVLIHDIVEIDAGDAFLHSEEELIVQSKLELQAAERIFSLLPEDQANYYLELWKEFELNQSSEARLAKALDRVQPALLHEATDAVVWEKCGTTHEQAVNALSIIKNELPVIWDRISHVIKSAKEKGRLKSN